ncbi:MAG: response regulator [Methylococcaceae bacterium]|jgi:PAS domain S-box-containing protein
MGVNSAEFTDINESIDAIYKVAIVSEADIHGNIIFVSDGFCKISGYSRVELIGKNHRIVNSGYHPTGFFKEMWKTITAGEIWRGQVCNKTKKGSIYWVESIIVPIFEKDSGSIKKYVSFRVDITEQKQAAENILKQQTAALSNAVVALSQGQLNADVPVVDGELITITHAVKILQKTLQQIADDILQLIQNANQGNLKYRLDTKHYVGGYHHIISGINKMLDIIVGATIDDGATALTKLAQGDFSARILTECQGDYDTYKKAVNGLAINLNNLISESQMINEATRRGELFFRIDSGKYTGDFALMTQILNQTMQEMELASWVKDGSTALSKAVLNENTVNEQVATALNEIARYVKAGMGCLYLFDNNSQKLRLLATFAGQGDPLKIAEYALGEGIVGQVAKERKPIHLTNVQSHIISTGISREAALNTYTHPLVYKQNLLGVIELAAHTLLDSAEQKYLQSSLDILASILFGSIQAEATNELLKRSQQLAEELEEQRAQLEQQQAGLEMQATELEISQRSIQEQNEQLANAQSEVMRQNQELVAANRYKSEFLANMSHELRTPLNSINILSNILAENRGGHLSDKQIEQAKVIHSAGADLLQLINDILDLAKLESKKTSLRIEEVDLPVLLGEVYRFFKPISDERDITLKCDLAGFAPLTIVTDKEKLRQIIKNFISNALKFTEKGGEISLGLYQEGTIKQAKLPVTIFIKDTGIGIPEDKIKEIFEAFKQIDGSSSRKYTGTGLGLSISKELASLLGGEIRVTSNLGYGSVFYLELPLIIDKKLIDTNLTDIFEESTDRSDTPYQFKQSDFVPEDDEVSGGVILIIEDDPRFAKTVADEALQLGIKSIIASDGEVGLRMAKQYLPNGIILDLHLPLMDGMTVLKRLKAETSTRQIPVKIISCEEPNLTAQRLGAVDFLQKPVALDVLKEALSQFMECACEQCDKSLLLVEDDNRMLHAVSELIGEKINGVGITKASNGLAAINAVKQAQFDLAIVDLGLPDISGFVLIEQLKELNPSMPIIIYSGRDFTRDELAKAHEYSDAIVLKTIGSDIRLIDEVRLFLHRMIQNFTQDKELGSPIHNNQPTNFGHKKVLVVDDDMRNIFALLAVLEELDVEVITAYDGQQALDQLSQNPDVGIVLMDIMMPVMNGYDAIEIIRKDKSKEQLPIIAVTAKAQVEDRKKCLDAGANDYLSKPVDTAQLIQLMKLFLGKN